MGLLALASSSTAPAQQEPAGDYSRKGADTCLACHDDATTMAVFRGKHGSPDHPLSPFGHGQLQCEACHGPGDAHSGRVRRGQERAAIVSFSDRYPHGTDVENGMCLGCHDSDPDLHWRGDVHAGQDVACVDCHDSHSPSDPVLQTQTQSEVCTSCHQDVRSDTLKAFGHPLAEGKMDCTSCHGVHDDNVATSLSRQTTNETCHQCHAAVRGPFVWEHAPVSEDCGSCHAAHGSNHPGMLTRRGPLLCQSCHSQQGHPSIPEDAGGLAGGASPSPFLLSQNCMNCHTQVHGSNHPSGSRLMR